MDPNKLVNQIQQHKVNRITASPYILERLARHDQHGGSSTFASIDKVFTGGAPVFPVSAFLIKNRFANAHVNIVYGSTESEPISSIDAKELVAKKDALKNGLPVGKIYHKAQVRVIKISEDAIPEATSGEIQIMTLEDSVIGEIIVSGPHVLKRYFNNDDAFKKNKIVVNKTIWHRTGDSGFMANGELYLTGRCQQLIYHNGSILSPFIIENQLQNIEGVRMGTLLDIDSKLVLIVEGTSNVAAVKQHCSNIPFDSIEIMDIPRDPRHNSKIDYPALKDLLKD
jgi:acyl-CoA synthetase (AMP-forming)/AMP-acid ligase II